MSSTNKKEPMKLWLKLGYIGQIWFILIAGYGALIIHKVIDVRWDLLSSETIERNLVIYLALLFIPTFIILSLSQYYQWKQGRESKA